MELKEKVLELLQHPILRGVIRRAAEKALKRGVQGVVAALTVLALQGQPGLDNAQAQVVLTGLVLGALEALRTSVKRVLPESLAGLL